MNENLAGKVRIMLVDDHSILRAGLANLLGEEPDFEVVAQASDGEAAVKLWKRFRPDVTLLDLGMKGMDGIETMDNILAECEAAKVVILTSSEVYEDIVAALKKGAFGYLTKNVEHAELVSAIRKCHSGLKYVPKAVSDIIECEKGSGVISHREIEVLRLVSKGATNADIGRMLGISDHTAKAHVASLLVKLQAADRAEAVTRGFERGLLKF